MSAIRKLITEFDADVSGLEQGYAEAGQWALDYQSRMESMKPPTISAPSFDPSKGMGGDMGANFAGALAPLTQIASRIEQSFDRVGGTITTLARRIDGAMKFESTSKAISAVQSKISSGFEAASAKAVEDLGRIDKAVLKWGPSVNKGLGSLQKVRGALDYVSNRGDVAGKSLAKLGMAPSGSGFVALAGNITGIAPASRVAAKGVDSLKISILGTLGVASGIGAIAAFFVGGIKGASDLNETVSKTQVVFGTATADVMKNADQMAASFGLPKKQILDASAAIGLLGKAAGQSQAEAAQMGVNLSKLAADASSFYNVPLDDALNKIRSGLSGEAEPLRSFGVLLSEAAVANEAVRMGLSKTGKDLTEGAKVQARYSLIVKGMSDAQGDLARTSDSTANRLRKLQGDVQNTAVAVGGAFLPAVNTALGGLSGFTSGVTAWVARNQENFNAAGQWLSGAFVTFGEGLSEIISALSSFASDAASYLGLTSQGAADFGSKALEWASMIGEAWRNLPAYLSIIWLQLKQGAMNFLSWIGVIPANLAQIGDYIANEWVNLLKDAFKAVGASILNLGTNLWNLGKAFIKFLQDPTQGFDFQWTPLLDGFKASAAKLPGIIKPVLTDLSDEVAAKGQAIQEKEAARSKRLADKAKADAERAKAQAAMVPKPQAVVAEKVIDKEADKAKKKLEQWAKSAAEKSQTPLEKYKSELDKINKAKAAGLIDDKTAGRIQRKAFAEMQGENKYAGAFRSGSTEAYSAILRASGGGKESGFKAVAERQEQGNAQLMEHTVLLRGIKGALTAPEKEIEA